MHKRILKFTLILVLIFSWIFGYPPIYENFWRIKIWQNPPFPPEIQEAQAVITFERTLSEANVLPPVSIDVSVVFPDDLIYDGSIGSVGLTLEPLLNMKWWGITAYTETENFISKCVPTASPLPSAVFNLRPGDYKTEISLAKTKEGCEAYSSEDFSGNVYPLFAVIEAANFTIK